MLCLAENAATGNGGCPGKKVLWHGRLTWPEPFQCCAVHQQARTRAQPASQLATCSARMLRFKCSSDSANGGQQHAHSCCVNAAHQLLTSRCFSSHSDARRSAWRWPAASATRATCSSASTPARLTTTLWRSVGVYVLHSFRLLLASVRSATASGGWLHRRRRLGRDQYLPEASARARMQQSAAPPAPQRPHPPAQVPHPGPGHGLPRRLHRRWRPAQDTRP